MGEKDIVLRDLTLEQSDVVYRLDELYKVMKNWCELHKWDMAEKVNTDKADGDTRSSNWVWVMAKYPDKNIRYDMVVKVKSKGKEVKIDSKGKGIKGTVNVNLECYLVTDADESWEKNPILKFVRAIIDNIFLGSKYSKLRKEIESECRDLYSELKSYLGLHVVKE